jgi:hypothetical protein
MNKRKKSPLSKVQTRKYSTKGLGLLIWIILGTGVFYSVYRYFVTSGQIFIMWIYGAFLLALGILYIVLNRGFCEWQLKESDLPSDWDDEQKSEYIAKIKGRKDRSKWVIALIMPLVLTFLLDFAELFLLDTLREMFGGGK